MKHLERKASIGVCLAGAALAGVALASRRIGDPDLGWHLATGRSILSHAAIPRTDDLAFGHAPYRYVCVIADVVLFVVVRSFGELGLQIFAALVALSAGTLVFFAARRCRSSAGVIAAALALASWSAWVAPGAALLSYPMLAATTLLIDRHRAAPSSKGGRRSLYALVPLFFIWANTHGSVAVGVALLATYVLHRAACRVAKERGGDLLPASDASDALPTALVAVAATLAATLNTAGPRILAGPLRFDEALGDVTEWQAPTVHLLIEHEPIFFVIAALGMAALLAGKDGAGRRTVPALFECIAIIASLVATTRVVRIEPLAAVVVLPIAARYLAWIVPRTAATRLAACGSVVASGLWLGVKSPTSFGVGFDPVILPVAATTFIDRTKPAGRMWNFWPFGGYLAWRLGPNREVFVDGRNTVAHDAVIMKRANESITQPNVFEALVDELDLEWAITRASTAEPLAGRGVARSKRFAMVYLDDAAAVYVRRDGANAGLANDGYRLLRHDTLPSAMLEVAALPDGDARKRALAHDGALAMLQAPTSTRSVFAGACGAIASKDEKTFESAVETLTRLGADSSLIVALRQAHGTR